MIENFVFYLGLVMVILLAIMLANKLKIAYPILLVVAGLAISFIPGIPKIKIDPELIFIIFLPPLLYEAAFSVSWKEIWRMRRIITSFAFIVVFLTALSVAFVANSYIPGFSLALGFVLVDCFTTGCCECRCYSEVCESTQNLLYSTGR